jgi:hypothetical protein
VDRAHPNIWIAEKLKSAFPGSQFIGIERDPFATIASMIKHKGVSAWHRRWRGFPVPNRFLGTTEDMVDTYDSLPIARQCALRWKAHSDRMAELTGILGDDLLLVRHESLSQETKATIDRMRIFLRLE